MKLGSAGKGFATLHWRVSVGLTEVQLVKLTEGEGGSQANTEKSCRQREQLVHWEHAVQGTARTPSFLEQNVCGG